VSIQQTLQTEIDESKRWLDRETDGSTYKRDLQKKDRIDKLGSGKYVES
jgi:hypothetical protein